MKRTIAILVSVWVAGILSASIGCDQSPAPAPSVPITPAATPTETKPTTQELLSGSYKKLMLPGAPLSIQVPQSWKIEMHNGGLTFLEGDTPSDKATIQLSNREPLSKERYAALLDRLSKPEDVPQPPNTPKKSEVREMGMMRIAERLSTGRPISVTRVAPGGEPVLDAQGNPIIDTSLPVRWLITVFFPEGSMTSYYELNCIGMTAEQYAADKELYNKVFASIRYEDGNSMAPTSGSGLK